MKLSEIRAELLLQHAELRRLVRDVLDATERWKSGQSRDDLHRALGRLSSLVRTHNAREEELLRTIMPGIDAWGPVRAALMLDEHVREHEDLLRALLETSVAPDASDAAPALADLAARMLQHMEREEKTFLGEDLLRDELGPPTDYFGG